MGIANETSTQGLAAALQAGIASISGNQTVSFTQYTKVVLSPDGYVFWVASSTAQTFTGSLHYITHTEQNLDETLGINRVIFSAIEEITPLNSINPQTMWVGTWSTPDGTIRIVFSERASFYQQAGVWHYSGFALYPALASQLVASSADLPVGPIVSNSLPIWLAQNSVAPVYASFLVPDNVVPPYIVAHIEPVNTMPVGQFPIYQWPGTPNPDTALQNMASSQLLRDEVTLILYGLTNQQATQYYVSLIEYSRNTDDFGFGNSPALQDEKRTQSEITAIAMKKKLVILASYYLNTADAIARRLLLSASFSSITSQPAGQTYVTVSGMVFGTGNGSQAYPLTVTL
jgi:hypothetical protein